MIRPKLEWPLSRGYTPREKERIRQMSDGNSVQKAPRDGRRLGPDGVNIAVRDLDRLADEPMNLRLDRMGKTLREGEVAESSVPWGTRDVHGRSSAAAPLSWEEFEGRYKNMDKTALSAFGAGPIKEVLKVFSSQEGKEEYRTLRTFSWQGEEGGSPSAVMLVGVAETSERSRQLAARAVYEAEPSALLVQLCRERVGRHLVMPPGHLATLANYARGFAASNPHGLRGELYTVDVINGDYEALKLWMVDMAYGAAVDEFLQVPSSQGVPKLLCLGDVQASRLEALRKQHGNESMQEVPVLSARGKQLARGLVSLCSLGHRVVVGIVSADLLATVTTWLERSGARFMAAADSSDIDAGRESIAADVQLGLAGDQRGLPRQGPPAPLALGFGQARLGAFLSERGLEALRARRRRLAKLTRVRDLVRHCEPPKVWKVAELLGSGPAEVPGPGAERQQPRGLRFEFGHLEVPEPYLREAGMEQFAPDFWQGLCDEGLALETRDLMELEWWAAGATEAFAVPSATRGAGDW